MGKPVEKQSSKGKENQGSAQVRSGGKERTFLIKNTSGQDLTVCGVRINPFERLKVKLTKVPKNLKRLEERGLIEIIEVNGG